MVHRDGRLRPDNMVNHEGGTLEQKLFNLDAGTNNDGIYEQKSQPDDEESDVEEEQPMKSERIEI
jgi:hypothetical protein